MTVEAPEKMADMMAALSQATRLRIVQVVAAAGEGGIPAGEIARAVQCPASTLSFHLKELSQAGLLAPQPEGRFIRYSVCPAAFQSLGAFVLSLPAVPPPATAPAPRAKRPGQGGRGRRKAEAAGEEGQLSIFDD